MPCGDPNGMEIQKKEGIYVYIQLTHFVVQQKLTQHYKATIGQLQKKKKKTTLPIKWIKLTSRKHFIQL